MGNINVRFPGLTAITDCNFSMGHGVGPGLGYLTIAPQDALPAIVGDLTMRDGSGGEVVVKDCRVSEASLTRDRSGRLIKLTLMDFRWRWLYPTIHGRYNLRLPDAPKAIIFEQSPQQLAEKCLQALGVTAYNVRDMPNAARPEVMWQHELAAQALDDLCRRLGCVIVPQIDGSVRIGLKGTGAQLPEHPSATSISTSVDLPEAPDGIRVVGGDTKFQLDVLLEAVGLDVDGAVKPIGQLSYAPTAGWLHESPLLFANVRRSPLLPTVERAVAGAAANQAPAGAVPSAGTYGPDTLEKQLALATIYRWYRITDPPLGIDNTALSIPGYGKINGRIEILPLFENQPETILSLAGVGDPSLLTKFTAPQTPGDTFNQPSISGRDPVQDGTSGSVELERPPMVWGFYSRGESAPDPFVRNIPEFDKTVPQETADSILPFWRQDNAQVGTRFTVDTRTGLIKFEDQIYLYRKVSQDQFTNQTSNAAALEIHPAILGLRIGCRVLDSLTNLPIAFTKDLPLSREGRGTGAGTKVIHVPDIVQRYWRGSEGRTRDGDGKASAGVNLPTNILSNDVNTEADWVLTGALQEYQIEGTASKRYGGILDIRLDGAIGQVTWSVTAGSGGGAFTLAGMNAEPYKGRISHKEARFYSEFWGNRLEQMKAAGRRAVAGPGADVPTVTMSISGVRGG